VSEGEGEKPGRGVQLSLKADTGLCGSGEGAGSLFRKTQHCSRQSLRAHSSIVYARPSDQVLSRATVSQAAHASSWRPITADFFPGHYEPPASIETDQP
jgi:hypothetical protein